MGCLLLSVVFGVGWYLAMEDRTSLYFSGFILGELLTEAARSGLLRLYFWPVDWPFPIEILTLAVVFSMSQFWLFLQRYLPELQRFRLTYGVGRVSALVVLGGVVWALAVDYRVGTEVWTWAMTVLVVALAVLLVQGCYARIGGASSVLAFFGVLSVFEFSRLLAVLGLLPFTPVQAALSPWVFVLSSLTLLLLVHRRSTEAQRSLVTAEAEGSARLDLMLSMGHELRSPLNAIVGHTRLLEHRGLAAEVRSGLASVRHNAERMLAMLDEILDYAQSRNHRLRLHLRPVSWDELTQRLARDAQALAAPDVRRLQLVIEGEGQTMLLLDERRLQQVIHNLVQNAVRHSNQASIGLLCKLHPATPRLGLRAEFVVQDSGPGIAPEDQAQVFEPFRRGKWAHLAHVSGLGMGLAMSRQLVQAMGGALELHSSAGTGCRFRFVLTPRC